MPDAKTKKIPKPNAKTVGKSKIDRSAKKQKYISVKGATLHNLKGVDVEIPRNSFTVVTGVSGSGKSSLAFDTIYAEGQRRFVESLSSYARQFLERMAKPEADSIDGLPPAIAIEQTPPQKNPRSTVGTSTEVYDYLRLLYGRLGQTIDKETGNIVRKDTPQSIVEELAQWEEGKRIYIMFQLGPNSGPVESSIKTYFELGYFRLVRNDGSIINLEEDRLPVDIKKEDFYILVDRLAMYDDEDTKTRMFDSIEHALTFGEGRITVLEVDTDEKHQFSNIYEDNVSGRVYVEPEPRLFAFNNAFGACPECQGFGRTMGIDENLVIPDGSLTINKGAVAPFKGAVHSTWQFELKQAAERMDIKPRTLFADLTDEQKKMVWDGDGRYKGIRGFFKELETKSYKVQNRVTIARYRAYTKCWSCGGSRLRTSARQVFIKGKSMPEIIEMPIGKLYDWVTSLEFDTYEIQVVKEVMREIEWRLKLLVDIGLSYLTLNRMMHTLSGGEAQRITLSTALGSSLVGTLYVLDEPSTGLHQRDTERLISIIERIRNIGNTVLVVEHDPEIMKEADYIIDMGPHAGAAGGEVVFAGSFDEIMKADTLTGKYLSGRSKVQVPKERRAADRGFIKVYFPRENNLKMDEVDFPVGLMTVVTGVSGSGKSTLVNDILYAGVKRIKVGYNGKIGKHKSITGLEGIEDTFLIDQSPIGRSSRSTPITYNKSFDYIRELYSNTPEASARGLKPGFFSFNVAGGRCDTCEGEGVITIDMQFLSDVQLTCETCNGTRYSKDARGMLYKGKSIVDVLNMTIDEGIEFFEDEHKIVRKLQTLADVGVGYLSMGQSSSNLSGGEAQRIKLAQYLDSGDSGTSLFIFDEPTTGLHLDDIDKLLRALRALVDKGNTVVIIEHNMHVIASADHIIDIGPEAGADGGRIVAEGTPESIAKLKKSITGQALKEYL
ncbi:MAG: excinuclease ABC subunit UvrA [Candidatus Kapaibacteriales bacterium]